MIFVIAIVEVAEGRRADFLNEFRQLVPKVREEAGCIEYQPAVDALTDIGAQQPARENVVTVIEKWESQQALQAHLAAQHMADYRESVKEIVLGTKIHILDPQ